MIDGTEKPKIPSMFVKHTAGYNEFGCNVHSPWQFPSLFLSSVESFNLQFCFSRQSWANTLHCDLH